MYPFLGSSIHSGFHFARCPILGGHYSSKLETAKRCCIDIYHNLRPDDLFTIVAFDENAQVVFSPRGKKDLEQNLRTIQAEGATNLSLGWRLGLLELQTYQSQMHINRLILLSDGQANKGETKKAVLAKESFKARELGITTSTIGIGNDFEEDILASLASESGGRFWYIQESKIEDIIKAEFAGSLSVLLERPRVKIDLPSGIRIVKELNDLKKISGKYLIRPIINMYNFAFRLELDPGLINSDEAIIKAVLYDGENVIKEVEHVILIRPFEEYVIGEENLIVKSIVQQYKSSKTDEEILEKIERGNIDFNAMKSLIEEDTSALIRLTGSLAEKKHITSKDLARESLYLEERTARQTGPLYSIMKLCEIDDSLPKRKGSETRIFNYLKRWKKLLKYTSQDAKGRFYGHKADHSIHLDLVKEALMIADDLIKEFPDRKDLIDIRIELNEHLERYQ